MLGGAGVGAGRRAGGQPEEEPGGDEGGADEAGTGGVAEAERDGCGDGAVVNALNRWLPTARVRGVSAGLHLLIELPPGCAEADAAAAAAARGIAVDQVAPMRAAPGGPPALVLGYARLPEHHLTHAGQLLAHAVHDAQARVTCTAWAP